MAIFQQKDDNDSFSSVPSTLGTSAVRAETVVGASVSLEGDFSSKEDIVIHGSVRGTINTEADLTIGEAANVHADITAQNVTISGTVEGAIKATGRLRVTATGRVQGDLSARTLAVEEGAEITGMCSMGKELEKQERVSSYVKEDVRSAEQEDEIERLVPEVA